ncbi:hypothetical protein [Agrobacterium pusense]|uniref:hypothetical protein n=1 Tax=Agrobacterium pusense TaxID=648995 RepID=UPI0037BFC902
MSFHGICIALIINIAAGTVVLAQEATQHCLTAYRDNMASVSADSQTAFAIETVARNECRSDGTAINAGYSEGSKSLIDGLTSSAKNIFGSYASTSAFCSAYKEGKFSYATSASYNRTPLEAMAAQFNSCMKNARDYRFAVWSAMSGPSEVIYHGVFYPTGASALKFRLNASAVNAECVMPGSRGEKRLRGREVEVSNEFSIVCRRNGRQEENATVYGPAEVTVWFNGERYPTVMVADRVFLDPQGGPTSTEQAKAEISALQTALAAAKAETATARSDAERLRARSFFSRVAYVGQHNASFLGTQIVQDSAPRDPSGAIIHYGCAFRDYPGRARLDGRNENDRKILGDRMGEKVCGKAPVAWQFMGHQEGNECGYDAFSFVCEK